MMGVRIRSSRYVHSLAQLVTDNYFHTLLVAFSATVFVFFSTKSYIPGAVRFLIPFLLLLLVTTSNKQARCILLMLVSVCLFLNVGANFYVSANHGFVIGLIGLVLLFALAANEGGERLLQQSATVIISILMGWALVQKLVSEHYMSGNLIGTYLATGGMFKWLLSLFVADWPQIVHDNIQASKSLLRGEGKPSASIVVPPLVAGLAILLTYTSLAIQAALEVLVLLRSRFGLWTHYAVMLFVLIIYSTRNENVFLSMNLILGYAMTDEKTKSARLWYVLGITYLLGMQMMHLRPGMFD